MYNQIAMSVANNAVSSAVVGMANVKSFLPTANNELGVVARDAVAYTLSDDLVTWFQTGNSKVLDLNWKGLVDDVAFNSAVILVGSRSGAIAQAVNYVDSVSPFSITVNNAIVDGGVMTVAQSAKDYLEGNPMILTTPLKYVMHPSQLLP